MNATTRVQRARATLIVTVAVSALVWAAAAAGGMLLLASLADLWVALSLSARRFILPTVTIGAVGVGALVLWRGRHSYSLSRVALFIEERVPALQYALVTALDAAGQPGAAALERRVASVNPRGALRPPVARALIVPALVLTLVLVALIITPAGALERVLHPRPGDSLLHPAVRELLASRLSPIAVRVEPPTYTRRAAHDLDDPSSVQALIGSRITVRGRGAAAGAADSLGAQLGDSTWNMAIEGDTWSAGATMPAKPAALRIVDREYDRLLVLEPIIDEPPAVVLKTPARDTTYQEGKGRLVLTAEVKDDIGLSHAHFELLHTSGGGEGFETKRTVTGSRGLGNMTAATIRAVVQLDTMHLGPGDVLNVRAIAWDGNDVTGPGKGESDTRTIRIYDPARKDTVNVNPAVAAALDTSILSQRMLIMRADTLKAHKSTLDAEDFVGKALDLGVRQGDLRNKVLSIVYDLEHVQGVGFVGETPSSKLLKQAADAMLEASTELRIASLSTALPHMWRALRLLQKARNNKRYWLRGLLLNKPVEVDRVRLTGTDPASVADRHARDHADDPRGSLLTRVDRAMILVDTARAVGTDSLKMILVDALVDAKDVTDPLRAAIDALKVGEDPRAPLLQVRRRLQRATNADSTLSDWTGGS
ncbi:MAG TPA: hypothetical protein VFK04_08610 [Gemmatimonadaceae bacterium]|nr:hypothetical protein [Gemmatimonadaceae bacterium]